MANGRSASDVGRELGLSRSTLRGWAAQPEPTLSLATCPRCTLPPQDPPRAAYAYLLGLYLGDGCLGRLRKGVWSLRIACADSWPGLILECERAMAAVHPGRGVFRVQAQGCVAVQNSWKHWPCLFPQHGPGRKHERVIALEPWQEEIVESHTGEFLRGLFHSDGCRVTNRVRRPLRDGDRWYAYPRYFFDNESRDILRLCGEGLDRLDIAWRYSRPNTISVARREAVAALDQVVGPKF